MADETTLAADDPGDDRPTYVLRLTGEQIGSIQPIPEGDWFVDFDEYEDFVPRRMLDAAARVPAPADGLDDLRALSDAATPGPWTTDLYYVVGEMPGGRPRGEVIVQCFPTLSRRDWRERGGQGERDAAFIVAVVNYVRAALDARLEAER